MTQMAHRGPDHSAVLTFGEQLLLGSTRLSIIDTSPAGNMPMRSMHGDCWIVYNGETYNYRELRDHLEARGFVFRSTSDTEVVVNAYLHWGEAFVEHLNGIFAFVIFDAKRRRLVAARDRFGVKPLYYTAVDGCLIHCSEFMPLRELTADAGITPEVLTAWMHCRFVPGDRTVSRDVFKFRPAEIRVTSLDKHNTRSRIYWTPCVELEPFNQRMFDARLDRALALTARSDVPFALLLSGGLDSSAAVAILNRQGAGPASLYSCAFAGSDTTPEVRWLDAITTPAIDERPFAAEVATHIGRTCEEIQIDVKLDGSTFESMLRALGEPIASPNAIGLYLFGAGLEGRTRLALAGTGADELLGGYEQLYFGMDSSSLLDGPGLRARFADFDRGEMPCEQLLRPELVDRTYLDAFTEDAMAVFPASRYPEERLNQLSVFELAFGLPGWELDQADRLFMAYSIELRPAFLENAFVDYCLTIPSRAKRGKQPLIDAVCPLLPASVVQRQKFPGLSTPLAILEQPWFRELMRGLLEDPSDCWAPKAVRQLVSGGPSQSFDMLYRVVYLDTWLKRVAR